MGQTHSSVSTRTRASRMSEPDNEAVQNAALRHIDQAITEEADEVLSSVHIDRHQMSESWNRFLAVAVHTSPIQQFGIGFGFGWRESGILSRYWKPISMAYMISGYLFRKVSRTAAFLVGCSFIALQGASALGIVNINWNRLRRVAERRLRSVSNMTQVSGITNQSYSLTDRIVLFCRQHIYITSGFTTGAVIAITF